MERRLVLGLIGSALLLIGAFLPIVSVPPAGTVNYVAVGRGDGMILIALAASSGVLVLLKKLGGLWMTALGSLGVLAYTFLTISSGLIAGADSGRALGEMVDGAVRFQWGWIVLLIGVIMLIIAAGSECSDAAEPVMASSAE